VTKLLYSATMSLDGFIAGPGGDMQWLAKHLAEPTLEAAALMEDIGALLVGANTNSGDDPNAGTDKEGAFGGEYTGPVVVLTHEPPERVDEGDAADQATRYATDLRAAVALSKQLAGDSRYVNVLGADVARQLIEAGELDEVLMFVAPVLLGDGVRMFEHAGGNEVSLRPLDASGTHTLWFEIPRD
jgi:dihydrofolate reductase